MLSPQSALFYFILFYFILFYFILFYFILFYFILFYFILFYFILFYFIYFILFYFILFYFILFYFILFYFNPIRARLFYRLKVREGVYKKFSEILHMTLQSHHYKKQWENSDLRETRQIVLVHGPDVVVSTTLGTE